MKKCNPFCHSLHEVIYYIVSLHIDEIFQAFISCHIDAYNLQIMKTWNCISENLNITQYYTEWCGKRGHQSVLAAQQTKLDYWFNTAEFKITAFPSVSLSHLAVHLYTGQATPSQLKSANHLNLSEWGKRKQLTFTHIIC